MNKVFKALVVPILAVGFSLVSVGLVTATNFELTGRVTNQSGVALSGAVVDAISGGSTVASATADDVGHYLLSISAGTYDVRVTPPAGSGFGSAIALNQDITANTSLDFVLVPAGAVVLSGRVLDSEGGGIAGQRVVLTPVGGTELATVITDDSGQYSFQVAPGEYNIRIASYNENAYSPASENAPNYYELATTSPISLTESTVLDIPLPEHRVSVHVQDTASNPVAGVALSTQGVYNTNLSVGSSPAYGYSFYFTSVPLPTTDTGGDATMWLFPNGVNGTYTLSAAPPAGSPFATFNVQNVEITSPKSIVIVLQFVHDAPVTTANLTPMPDVNGEYSNPTTVALSATAFSGFTVAATYYSIDTGPTETYTGPISVSGAGPHTIRYWSVDNSGVFEIPNSRTFTINAQQLTELGTSGIWLGLKNSDDVGTKFDLLAEVLKNGAVVGSGQLDNVPGGSSGFNNAVLRTIDLALSSPVSCGVGETLSIRLSVRIAVGVAGHRSGTARLWFNDATANSRFSATIGGTASDYFLVNGFTLGTGAGPGPKKTIDVFVDRLVDGNGFKPFGTWSKTF